MPPNPALNHGLHTSIAALRGIGVFLQRWARLALLGGLYLPPAVAAELPPTVRTALQQAQIPLGEVAIEVRELGACSSLLSLNAEQPMNPASVMKLLTTLAGLELLGPAYTWPTDAYLDGTLENGVLHGDLILKGYGNPNLSVEQFGSWLREWRQRGLRVIDGNLVLDRRAFTLDAFNPAAFDNDPLRPYNAGADALNLGGGVLHLRLVPTENRVQLLAEPPVNGLTLDNQLHPVKRSRCGEWDDGLRVTVTGEKLQLAGDFPVVCGERDYYLNPLTPGAFTAAVFRSLWQELGGTLSGDWRDGSAPVSVPIFSRQISAPLAEQIRATNKFSNNLMARQLFLSLSASESQPGSVARSTAVIHAWLQARGQDFPELVLENGAGLSRRERISARHLAELLQWAHDSPLQPEFVASLPLAGVDGTLKKRYRDQPIAGFAHLKSGTLDNARALAGYVQSRSGRRWLVVLLINSRMAHSGGAAQDALLNWVFEQ